ncbi:MAG: polyphosphate:AMP phosphotransferase [Clostridiales bacterium]|nr:polyphosphate:AMP phosphotransferase [Clostridiales bacterium]
MLKSVIVGEIPTKEELGERLKQAALDLSSKQMLLKEKKIPVLVVFEGWGAAGKGSVLGKVIQRLDPRFFRVDTMSVVSQDEARRPFLYRYFKRIPEAGRFAFLDGGWADEIVRDKVAGGMDEKEYQKRVVSVKRFERTLTDNGYLVLKFFFNIGKDEQKKRLDGLREHKITRWRVSDADIEQNRRYKEYEEAYSAYLNETNQSTSPWYVIDAADKKWAELQVLDVINQGIDTAMKNNGKAVPILQNVFPLVKTPKLSEITFDGKELTDEEYDKELDKCRKKLSKLHNELYRRRIPVVLCYEGWDAAGKGGNIKRITSALDPRGYEVHPIASPEPHEKARHYLWRFWTRLPKNGHVAIFDRTWYGRVMVERLEGFCSENDWQRAYNEMNEFEKELADWGAIVIKFWVHIDKDTQLERFTERQNTPSKQWKITDEDWRNREKWDLYETAVNEMLEKTNTAYAPWVVLESKDKKYARIKALKTVIKAIEDRLE